MKEDRTQYIPALRYEWLTGFYDTLMDRMMRETTFKEALVRQAQVAKSHRVLDLGCGTATLTLLIKQTYPDAQVTGLDGDPKALEIARDKVARSDLAITLEQGLAFNLPYQDNSFDRVFSSLLFHHLAREDKARTLNEIYRVLSPGGELHVADWGQSSNVLMRLAFLMVQFLDGFKTTTDNVNGRLPQFFGQAGLQDGQATACYATLFGTLTLYKASKPAH
ncbi:MAG: methyltransferase domain-containing protein [Chloroflexi bacterium]|nr:methyltransferase domain-containing protein [Chloroflexota bacterium]